jgi:hypothetical protein
MRRFTIEGDFVIDHEKQITWMRAVSPPLSRAAAARYCPGLNAGGEGWRAQDLNDLSRLHGLAPSTTPFAALGLDTPRYLWAATPGKDSSDGGVEQVEVPTSHPFRYADRATAPVRCVRDGTKLPKACDKETLRQLQGEKERICKAVPGGSCDGAKVSARLLLRYPCSEIHKRIEGAQECLEAGKAIRDECFGGTPDEKEQDRLRQLEKEIKACVDLGAMNCAAGHPMASK